MLVNYSSSSDEEDEVVATNRNNNETRVSDPGKNEGSCQTRFLLPSSVMEMFRDSEEQHFDHRAQHGGRLRSFQHERGNWATYVYLPCLHILSHAMSYEEQDQVEYASMDLCEDEPEDVFLELLDELRVCVAAHGVTLTRAEEFHVSLSQTVILRHHWIQPFVQSLRSALATCSGFVCLADKLKVYSNQEKTRTFLGMEISTGHMQLLEVVKSVDKVMEEFNLSTYYEDPSFHLSLAWCVGDFAEKLQHTCLAELQSLMEGHEDEPFQIRLKCKELRCKTGNKFYQFPIK